MEYIYIMTNPIDKNIVKIGSSVHPEERLKEVNRAEGVIYAFRLYATYEVPKHNADIILHKMIDLLNDKVRIREIVDDRKRVKEFFELSPEDAYKMLECIADITGTRDKLVKVKQTKEDIALARKVIDVENEGKIKRDNFKFSMIGLKPGDEVLYKKDPNIKATVYDEDNHILLENNILTLTRAAKTLLGRETGVPGPEYWTYKGKQLSEIRREKEGLK